MLELQGLPLANYVSLKIQVARMWNAFSIDMAHGILRAVNFNPRDLKHLDKLLDRTLGNLNEKKNDKDPYSGRILADLIYLDLPGARSRSIVLEIVEKPPPVPDFDGEDSDKKSKRPKLEENSKDVAKPQSDTQILLNSSLVQISDIFDSKLWGTDISIVSLCPRVYPQLNNGKFSLLQQFVGNHVLDQQTAACMRLRCRIQT